MTRHVLSRKTFPAWAVLGVCLIATAIFSLQVKRDAEIKAVREFAFTCDQIVLKIRERLGSYALILRGGAALFAASETVERDEWRNYVEELRAQGSVPGVQGIGYSQVIAPGQLAAHVAAIRREGFPDYAVRPAGDRAFHTSIIYLEPFSDRNLRAFGYDMFSEPVRRVAMEQARDSGEAALSGKVELVQETGKEVQAGTLMYMPVYRNGMKHDTVDERRAALVGWTYSPYRMNDLMTGILGDWNRKEGRNVDLHIYDGGEAVSAALLFDSRPNNHFDVGGKSYQQRQLDFNGRTWLLRFNDVGATAGPDYLTAWGALAAGLAVSGLLFGLMISLVNTRINAIRMADRLTADIVSREEQLKESEYRWKFALEGAEQGVWDWNVTTGKVFFSRRWKEMLGFAENEVGDGLEEWEKRVHPGDKAETLATVQAYLEGRTPAYVSEHRVLCKDGGYKWILDRGMVVSRAEDGKPLRVIGTHSDITARKAAEESVRHLAHHDALTDLPNRALLTDRLHQALAKAKRDKKSAALMFLDLDKFKPVNDTLGHDIGDLLLKDVALRLRACLPRESDTVSRFGGDEFVVLLADIAEADNAAVVAGKILHVLTQPFNIDGHVIGISTSIGIAIFPAHGADAQQLMKSADMAMYQAKQAGRGCYRYFGT